jgi:Ner family transcriptional regulator
MHKKQSTKKPADLQTQEDWHWADVMAAIRKNGWSLRQIALAHGYATGTALGDVARRAWPKGEAILAVYVGVDHPKVIWPSRYDAEGRPSRRSGRAPMRGKKPPSKATTGLMCRNAQTRASA